MDGASFGARSFFCAGIWMKYAPQMFTVDKNSGIYLQISVE